MPEKSHHSHHQQGLMGEESPRLCTDSSLSSHDPTLADYCSLSTEHTEGERPVSTVSTISSGSSGEGQCSLFSASHCAHSMPYPPTGTDISLELSPAECQFNNNASTAEVIPTRLNGPSPVASVVMAPNSQLTYKDRVVMEIIETERMYVSDLHSIVKDYLAHIIDTRDLPIKPEQVSSLFGNIEVIYEFNSELLQSLEMCDNDPVAIADCFVDKSEYFQIYTQYCTNYPNSVATLTDCMRNKTLAKFFRERQASLRHSLPLGAYLLKPVQRILKYHLLLQEIAKHFDPEEEGYDLVEEAIETMTGVAWYINDMKRKHEHAVRLQEIQSLLVNWKGPDLTTYGELVLEGTFHVQRAKNERTLFLFEKMLLITKKRGEHYVYKTHIMCSTLMLIESAKDSLRFSVTHYKRPKQPHTMQAKTVDERKLWAHHIKRLILENHHAIIPQTAKDAILDMSSPCPVKYRFSPDRQNKPVSCKGEDVQFKGRKGRRQSEPFNRDGPGMMTSKEMLKHADSVGALLSDSNRCSLQATASVSTLNSSHDEAEPERTVAEELSRSERLSLRSYSLDRLEVCRLQTAFQRGTEVEEEFSGSGVEEDEESLVKNEQVADFASSVMAAISCWRYRARALLFTWVPTNREREEAVEENELVEPKRIRHPSEEQEEESAPNEQDLTEDHCSQTFSLPGEADKAKEQWNISPQDESKETEEIMEDSVESVSSAHNCIQLEDEITSTSMNLSEDAEDHGEIEDEDDDELLPSAEPTGILPTSVLDKASVIAEQFTSSLSRRSSLATDDMFSTGCTLSSRRSSVLSLNAEPVENEKSQDLNCASTELPPLQLVPEQCTTNTLADRLVQPDQRPQPKQDTLSKKDRMLIHKIKQYYEHAEDQDVNFSIRRRESLSYIPAGLVRNLRQQLNDHSTEESAAVHRKDSLNTRPTSWDVFDLPGLQKEKCANQVSDTEISQTVVETCGTDRTEVVDKPLGEDNDFRPSSEMIKVWQDMEVDINGPSRDLQYDCDSNNAVGFQSNDASPSHEQNGPKSSYGDPGEPLLILEELDNAGQESLTPSPDNSVRAKKHELEISPNSDQNFKETCNIRHVPLPKIISLRSGSEEDLILQDMEKMKNKVFHLARQYSQRIKKNRPLVRQRAKEIECHNQLASVMEVSSPVSERGILNPTLSPGSCEHIDYSPLLSPCSTVSSRTQSTTRSPAQGPQSPVYNETFHWPDVRVLRSKYSQQNPQPHPIIRSNSVPEPGPSHSTDRCSFSDSDTDNLVLVTTASKDTTCLGPCDQELAKLGAQSSYYISGQATLPNDNKVIVVERIPETKAENGPISVQEEGKEETQLNKNQLPWMDSDADCLLGLNRKSRNSQQSLVKNLREKFQNLSSYT
ncbi:pleckstrin homology domain-containing family G member 3 [Trichomycterus rosablanca]|uniref:pleckstrin homology domain-containing family G member 3 n=1 Tax=Trichomycterus rosablanca TaxID=2290929 RepID=UPI002F35F7C0